MGYCTQCGAPLEENTKFCTQCGAPCAPQPSAQSGPAQPFAPAQEAPDASDVQQNKGKAALSYVGILILVPLLTAKDSAFAKFHINQGLILLIASVATEVLANIAKVADLDTLSGIVGLLGAVIFVFRIIGFVWALQGKAKALPLVGDVQLLK